MIHLRNIERFVENVKTMQELITEFGESLLCMAPLSHMWAGLVDGMTVHGARIVFRLTCGDGLGQEENEN